MTGLIEAQSSPISIVPNPSSGVIHFVRLPEGEFNMQVVDMQSRTVTSEALDKQTIDLSNLASGCYSLHLISSNGLKYSNRLVLMR